MPRGESARKEPAHESAVSSTENGLAAPTTLNLPKGGGAVRGIGEKFSANPVTGTSSMTVPIAVSPGRAGFAPQLSLSYDSGSGNGVFGLGWALPLPSITRKTDKGLPRYQDADEVDVFLLSGAEDLVPVLVDNGLAWAPEAVPNQTLATGTYVVRRYRPRVESLFARIERWSHESDASDVFWRSISRDNVTTWYGRDANSRIFDPNDPTHIYSWIICESRDDKGNAIAYEYAAEDSRNVALDAVSEAHRNSVPQARTANRHIKYMRYGNRVSHLIQPDLAKANWLFEVVFDYGEGHYAEDAPDADGNIFASVSAAVPPGGAWAVREDPFSSRRAGFENRTYRLCRRVLMIHHFDELAADSVDYLVRATEFSYVPSPVATVMNSVSQAGFVWNANKRKFIKRALPSLDFEFSAEPTAQELAAAPIRQAAPKGMANLPIGLNGGEYFWADLRSEGISGVVVLQGDSVSFKPNRGDGEFGPLQKLARTPSLAAFGAKSHWQDITGAGRLDLVLDDGFYAPDDEQGWVFRYFENAPTIDRQSPDAHNTDQTGDGRSDVLLIEGSRSTLYESLGENGFAAAQQRWMVDIDVPEKPILLADMTGDGLADILTIRNGSVRYRPSLGYGRFGPAITMDNSPWFDAPDEFDPRRIRLADVDGSGTTDILYLAADGIRLYRNQSGNGWSAPVLLPQFRCDDLRDDISVVDFLGTGTACLVWSSPLSQRTDRPLLYVDLMAGQKPHLLVSAVNNLGAETRITYASSTHFYLQDERNGTPWVTQLPFPVHVVERVETFDYVSRNRFVTRYAYHHGYFDGAEREFRGFGMVEQWDTEQFAALAQSTDFPTGDNVDAASHVPPTHTKTWFHTGVYFGGRRVSDYFAGLLDVSDTGEYFREPGLDDAQARGLLLDDTILPADLSVDEEREACRALKGSMLRREVYALDGSADQARPYVVSEQNFGIECLQPQSGQRHAVFFTHGREVLTSHYERRLVPVIAGKIVANGGDTTAATWQMDPRVQHELTLKVDSFGNVLSAATINYGRRFDSSDAALSADDRERQRLVHIVVTSSTFTNAILDQPDAYRSRLPAETLTCEMRKPTQELSGTGLTAVRSFDEVRADVDQAADGSHDVEYEDIDFAAAAAEALMNPAEATKYFRRPIEQVRVLYRPDDFGVSENDSETLLPLGQLQSLALPGERFRLAFTPGLLSQVYQRAGQSLLPANLDPILAAGAPSGGGYVSSDQCKAIGLFPPSDPAGTWWLLSGRVFLSPGSGDTAAKERTYARKHFFFPLRMRDPFANVSSVLLDHYDLLTVQTRDALGNLTTAGERKPSGAINAAVDGNDYRVLQPSRLMDPNRNRTLLAFDALGMVVGTAVCGKPEEDLGDSLTGFRVDLDEADLLTHLDDPLGDPWSILAGASTRLLYDFDAYRRSIGGPGEPQPACVYTLARETHVSDEDGRPTKMQHSFSYSDGFGREIQKKVQAEPASTGTVVGPPRWTASGWVVLNNKGKKVREYESFFSDTHEFQFGVLQGVSAVFFYDAADRVVATLHPNNTYEKVVFDPWRQRTFDVNDTAAARDGETGDPRTDVDVAGELQRYFAAQPASVSSTWQTWYQQRAGGAVGPFEQQAATQAADHANTPTTAHFDTMGRPFLTLTHNRVVCAGHLLDATEDEFATRSLLDIEGNEREVQDAEGRIVMQYDYDMLGHRIHQASMEAGERWMLGDVAGKTVRAWDSRGHDFTTEYDELRRPVRQYVLGTTSASDPRSLNQNILFESTEYGESQPNAADFNLLTRVFRHSDTAGVTTCKTGNPVTNEDEAYDFKGNLLRSGRRLVADYTALPDWQNPPEPDPETFISSARYDALNRVTQSVAPHSDQAGTKLNVIQHVFNEANLLERIDVWLGQATEPGALIDPAGTAPSGVGVTNIHYNARGQRTLIEYRNGAKTAYSYDPATFRLVNLRTTRPAGANGLSAQIFANTAVVQDLRYTFDPAGNITRIEDAAVRTIFYAGQQVDPVCTYIYDANYRLIEATGREHIGQTASDFYPPNGNRRDYPFLGLRAHPFDAQAMRNYTESYVYDAVGNFDQMRHSANGGSWTRTYTYNADSLVEAGKKSNRLTKTVVGNGTNFNETYGYADTNGNDSQGCMTSTNGLKMVWDFEDRLRQVDLGGGRTAYYTYDASGERMRKVIEASGGMPQEQRSYFGIFEDYREYKPGDGAVALKRETLHVMDDKQRIALVENRTSPATPDPNDPLRLIRYQLSNHLGSTSLELDDGANGISHEEYTPHGCATSQIMGLNSTQAKRYRYAGMERDEENGLCYQGARYYIPWVARWLSTDPASISDGPNTFLYVRANPIVNVDHNGRGTTPAENELFRSLRLAQQINRDTPMSFAARLAERAEEIDPILTKYGYKGIGSWQSGTSSDDKAADATRYFNRAFRAWAQAGGSDYLNTEIMGDGYQGTPMRVAREALSASVQRDMRVGAAIAGANLGFGAIGYGIGGNKGAIIGDAIGSALAIHGGGLQYKSYYDGVTQQAHGPLQGYSDAGNEIYSGRTLFGQKRAGPTFSSGGKVPAYLKGRSTAQVARALRRGTLTLRQLPVRAFIHEGQLVSENTRTLGAISEAGLKPTEFHLIEPTHEVLGRLGEAPLIADAPLPGTKVPVTPSQSDLRVMRTIRIPGSRK